MTPTLTDAPALLRAICEAPDDDAPRLIYADYLDEHAKMVDSECSCSNGAITIYKGPGATNLAFKECPRCEGTGRIGISNGKAERAEFIRIGVELARIGPPPIVVTERCYVSNRYGPNYYTMTGGEETKGGGRLCLDPAFAVGARVDVMKPRGRKEPMYGLRIHKIDNGPQRDEVIVVQDAKSVKWEGDALRRRERELLESNGFSQYPGSKWLDAECPELWKLSDRGATYKYERGFVSSIRLTMSDLIQHGPAIVAAQPIERIEVVDRQPWHSNGDWGFAFLCAYHPEHDGYSDRIHREIFDLLWDRSSNRGVTVAGFPTESSAVAALSAAALAWCRAKAGLGERVTQEEETESGHCDICNGSGMPGGVSGYPCPGCSENK